MAYAPKVFKAVKLAVLSSCHRKQLFSRKFELVNTWTKPHKPAIDNNFAIFLGKLSSIRSHCIRNVYSSGSKFSIGSAVGVSAIIGSVAFSSRFSYAMDGLDIMVEDSNFLDGFDEEKHWRELWMIVRKLWLPAAFVLTVLLNLGKPVLLCTQVLCQKSMRQAPYLYLLKSLYAKKVEVTDYGLFCLATVEVRDQKLTVVGILGGLYHLQTEHLCFGTELLNKQGNSRPLLQEENKKNTDCSLILLTTCRW